jgi:hypothetical protein
MTAKPQSYLYIGDAAARATEFDIIVRRSGRYILCEMGCGAVTGDWYLIEESQPQQPMFRLDKNDVVSFEFAQKCVMLGRTHYVACAQLCKNYSEALHHIELLGLESRELESISWLSRRWRLFPVNKVDPPPPVIQESINTLSEWFRRDTTSVVMIQPKIRPTSTCRKVSWLNMHEWAPRDIRRLLLSYLDYGDMIMVEAAHGLRDKLKLPIIHACKYPKLICWHVHNGHPIDQTLCNALTSWHLYYPMQDLVVQGRNQIDVILKYAIQNNNVDFINALVEVVPLYRIDRWGYYMTSFAYAAARFGHYDLMFDLMLPSDVYSIYELIANDKRVDICERMHACYPMKHEDKQCIKVIATALQDAAMLEYINTITPTE